MPTVKLTQSMSTGKQQWVDWHRQYLDDLPARVKVWATPCAIIAALHLMQPACVHRCASPVYAPAAV